MILKFTALINAASVFSGVAVVAQTEYVQLISSAFTHFKCISSQTNDVVQIENYEVEGINMRIL